MKSLSLLIITFLLLQLTSLAQTVYITQSGKKHPISSCGYLSSNELTNTNEWHTICLGKDIVGELKRERLLS